MSACFALLTEPPPTPSILPLVVSAESGLVNLPHQSLLVVLHVGFHRLQQERDLLLAERQLEGGELLHLCFELLRVWTRRKLLVIMDMCDMSFFVL